MNIRIFSAKSAANHSLLVSMAVTIAVIFTTSLGADEPAINDWTLNYHLMHPGGESMPADPNAAFYLDGVYHLHYIVSHPWKEGGSFSFVHVTSPDMLHWTWQTTKLQPSFTGHGMFSGTGFITKDGRPAVIYHGQGSGRNQIAIATDNQLSSWEKPFPVDVRDSSGTEINLEHWDPDCFLVGDTYYAISGGENPPLLKSSDLKTWTVVGNFLSHELLNVMQGEDVSCANFFPLGDKWMLLCISHGLGCRYYLGEWDAPKEQFVPEYHGRMNWRRNEQSIYGRPPWRADFFAPESVATPDGRRVFWAWLATIGINNGNMSGKSIQSLPREVSLPDDGVLRIRPLRELESLRQDHVQYDLIKIDRVETEIRDGVAPIGMPIAQWDGDSMEIRMVVKQSEAARKMFGVTLFSDGNGDGLPIMLRPETGSIRVGSTEAPFSIADLDADEDLELRIFIDKYLVEVFVNDRQAVVASFPGYLANRRLAAFSVGAPVTLERVELWKLRPANEGYLEAKRSRIWEPRTN